MTESQILKSCLELLEAMRLKGRPVYATRTNSGRVRTIKNQWVCLCREGWPDITAVVNGRLVGIETKRRTGSQLKTQEEAQKAIEAAGGVYLIIRRPSELRQWLEGVV